MAKSEIDKQAAQIVSNFSNEGIKGELLRNRLGSRVWPLAAKGMGALKWGAIGAMAFGAAPLSIAAFAAIGGIHLAQTWTKGHIKYLQNLTLKNASLLGRSMKNTDLPDAVKKRAIEKFMQRESPLFTANRYIKKNPDMIERMSQGMVAKKNRNFVSFWDANTNALASKKNIKFSDRLAAYKRTFQQWRAAAAEEKAALKATQNGGRTLAEAASEVSVKRALEEISQRPTHAASQITQQTTNQIAQQVGKTAVTETGEKALASTAQTAVQKGAAAVDTTGKAGRLPLGKALIEKISSETMKKTGAKIATMTSLKIGAKKIPVLGAVFGAAFAAGRAVKGDWTGAGMEFSSGVASCFPGVGTAASLGIDGALLAKDLAGSR